MRSEHLGGERPALSQEELAIEKTLRPSRFAEFRGQKSVTDNLEVFVAAARGRGEALDHVLLHGPPGLGKTTLAHIIARELGAHLHISSGPVLDKPANLAGILTKLEARDVLFIDEIHRLNPTVEEYLYSAMEDFRIDILLDSGQNTQNVSLSLLPFTLIGATTRAGLLTAPLRERFGIKSRLEYYDDTILQGIVQRAAQLLSVPIDEQAAFEIGRRSRGTPRIAGHLLRRTRDFAQIKSKGHISLDITNQALSALGVDKNGLDDMDNSILATLVEKFDGGPVGLTNLATSVNEEADTIAEVYEPFLIQNGYMKRTARGREATKRAYFHLGRTPPKRPGEEETALFGNDEKPK